MKSITKIFAGLLATLAMASASAIPMSITASFTPATPQQITTSTPYDLIFNLGAGYHAGIDKLTSGTMVFDLSDPNKDGESIKFIFSFSVNNLNGGQIYTVTGGNNNDVNNGNGLDSKTVVLNSDSITDLSKDGQMAIRLAAISGEYYFNKVSFSGMYEPNGFGSNGNVPEPFSLALMGIGFAGVAVARRRKA